MGGYSHSQEDSMNVFTEATHSVGPVTHRAFDRYVEIYSVISIPLMERHGYDVLGA